MNFSLTPEQQQVQARARAFAQDEVAPLAREAVETGKFALHRVRRMGEWGFLAGPIGPDYGVGGAAISVATATRIHPLVIPALVCDGSVPDSDANSLSISRWG